MGMAAGSLACLTFVQSKGVQDILVCAFVATAADVCRVKVGYALLS